MVLVLVLLLNKTLLYLICEKQINGITGFVERQIIVLCDECICLTSLTRAKWNFPLNFRTMRKLSDLYSGIFQNSLTRAKWNFLLNFCTMCKLSDLYSGIFQNY